MDFRKTALKGGFFFFSDIRYVVNRQISQDHKKGEQKMSDLVIENIRLKELMLVVNKNKPFFDEFKTFLLLMGTIQFTIL